jgi:hypothetical protein
MRVLMLRIMCRHWGSKREFGGGGKGGRVV